MDNPDRRSLAVVIEHEHDRMVKTGVGDWVIVDIAPERKLKSPISLAQIKMDIRFKDMALVRSTRLSVQPVKKEEFDLVIKLSEGE